MLRKLRTDAASLEGANAQAKAFLTRAEAQLDEERGHFSFLARRKDAALRQLEEVERAAARGVETSAREASAALAKQLRLLTDAYSLDETEALHLLREGNAGRGVKR